MHAPGTPKGEMRSLKDRVSAVILAVAHSVAALAAKSLENPYWFAESWRSRLADRIENERSDR